VSGGPDETLGLRLGPLFRLPDGNLLGHQTKSLGSKGIQLNSNHFFKKKFKLT
jgi:hypothetical protein